ncbi:predicted protein [Sclerotinia sclerotiorum 1980 UF-70]|uniref:Secreted protein n=1 Tax=Sclerotinia sclerotiorum (strain ATCC 18683 / 1980 / Ss-1) TaxID=665079 RepID=A7EYN5_SCLS1|nr:predicted protein [Sclerotinia sclerotiorum 1980 UF-70]EDN94577.1 predicted protein [Sclerotinia sclerotiorum 1980 UF-70]
MFASIIEVPPMIHCLALLLTVAPAGNSCLPGPRVFLKWLSIDRISIKGSAVGVARKSASKLPMLISVVPPLGEAGPERMVSSVLPNLRHTETISTATSAVKKHFKLHFNYTVGWLSPKNTG